jgi:hypothetical protein
MNRSLIIVLGALVLGITLFGGSYLVSQRLCQVCVAPPPGGLDWLQQEFHPNADQMARIQKLHKDYLVQCADMCRMVADKKQEVSAALNGTTNISPVAEQKLAELADCRAHCQSQMFQYFAAVSQNMPPDQGRRYLAEMQKFALGLPGGNQQSMSETAGQ